MPTLTVFFAMLSYSLVMSISPGPVNMITLSSGINHGFKRTFGFVSGATIGFTCLLACIGLGLGKFIQIYPKFLDILTLGGCAFIMYLGCQIFMTKGALEKNDDTAPLKMTQGFALQWLNPKAWISAVSGVGMFSEIDNSLIFLTFLTVYFITCYACISLWALAGKSLIVLLNNETLVQLFNRIMGASLILIAVYLLMKQFL